jgi:hypothetical protein
VDARADRPRTGPRRPHHDVVAQSRNPWDNGDLAGTKLFMVNLIDPDSGYVQRHNMVRMMALQLIASTHEQTDLSAEQKSRVTVTVIGASNELISDLGH